MGVNLINSVFSGPQRIVFYNSSLLSVTCDFINIEITELINENDSSYNFCDFSFVLVSEKIGTVETFNDSIYDFIDITVEAQAENIDMSPCMFGPFIINYRSTVRYEIYKNGLSVDINIPDEILRLGKKRIVGFSETILDISGSINSKISDSFFPEILSDAVKSKNISLLQLFYVKKSIGRKHFIEGILSSMLFTFDNYCLKMLYDRPIVRIVSWPEAMKVPALYYSRYEHLPFSKPPAEIVLERHQFEDKGSIYDGNVVKYDGEISTISGGEIGSTYDLSDSIYFMYALTYNETGDIYSRAGHIRVESIDLNGGLYQLARNKELVSFEDFVSYEIEVVRILAPDGWYRVVDLRNFYSNPIYPSVSIYTDGNLSNINDSVYSFAKWFGHEDLNEVNYFFGRITTPTVEMKDLHFFLSDELSLSVSIVEKILTDLRDASYKFLIATTGTREIESRRIGLSKVFYLDAFDLKTNYVTAWYNPGRSTTKISDTVFMSIGFDVEINNWFSLIETMDYSDIVLLSWERRPVDNYMKMISNISVPPHYIVYKKDYSDFVSIALSSSGGSVLHMHSIDSTNSYLPGDRLSVDSKEIEDAAKDYRFIADSYFAESSAREISSRRYRYYSKVINDTESGNAWPQHIVNDAIMYLSDKVKYSEFFNSNNYNAYQIFELIYNKNVDVIDDNFFSRVPVFFSQYGFVYSYSPDYPTAVATERIISNIDFVVSHRINLVGDSYYQTISNVFSKTIGKASIFYGIIDICVVGSSCLKYSLSKDSVFLDIFLKEEPTIQLISNPTYPFRNPTYDFETGITDIEPSLYNFPRISALSLLDDCTSGIQYGNVSIGNEYEGLFYDGHMFVGLATVNGVKSSNIIVSLSSPDYIAEDVYSEFSIRLSFSFSSSILDDVRSQAGNFSIDKGVINLSDVKDTVESIWLKMFFPMHSDRNFAEATVMQMFVFDSDFSKDIVIPFKYVNDYLTSNIIRGKGGDGDIKEEKIKDSDGEKEERVSSESSIVCGEDREMTLLEFENFNHILSFDDRNLLWGNYTSNYIETINSPFIKLIENKAIMPGMLLSESDAMSKTIAESILSNIENVDDVYDWKIEEFTLEKEDFENYAINSESLSLIDDSLRSSLKFVIATLGDEVIRMQENGEAPRNMFPSFPDRPIDDKFLDTHKVQQYFKVVEYPEDV